MRGTSGKGKNASEAKPSWVGLEEKPHLNLKQGGTKQNSACYQLTFCYGKALKYMQSQGESYIEEKGR